MFQKTNSFLGQLWAVTTGFWTLWAVRAQRAQDSPKWAKQLTMTRRRNIPNCLQLPKRSQDGQNWLSIIQDSSNGILAQNVGIAKMSKDINEN